MAIVTRTNIEDYEFNPRLETAIMEYKTPVILNGKEYLIMDDYWMKHVHIKITDKCDAHCPFCIEKNSHVAENKEKLLASVKQIITELDKQGHLATVSITGGEPSLCEYVDEVIDFVKKHNAFLNINTNFSRVIVSKEDPDWLNISAHNLRKDDDKCGVMRNLEAKKLSFFRNLHPFTKIRVQCVLYNDGLKSVKEIDKFIHECSKFADDVSFRRLITTDKDTNGNIDLYTKLKHYLYACAEFKEQTLKDYYVYETWNLYGIDVTLSHSNMAILREIEQVEPDNLLREIVIHPDGLVSGSWYRNKKIIIQ